MASLPRFFSDTVGSLNKQNTQGMKNFTLPFMLIILTGFFDPQNALGIRPIILYLSLPLWIYGLKPALTDLRANYVSMMLCYAMPLWGLMVYAIRGDGAFRITDTSYISFALIFSIINLLATEKTQESFKKASIVVGLAFSILLIYAGVELIILNTSVAIDFLISNEIARVSFREYGGINIPYVYFYASTLLILPLSVLYVELSCNKGSALLNICFLTMLLALFLSGTRSHIVISTLLFIAYVYGRGREIRIIGTIAIVFTVIIYGNITDVIMGMVSSEEGTNSQKISMLDLYAKIFDDPMTILIGQGYQAVAWSTELQQMVFIDEGATKTELTFLELFRVYGAILPWFILFAFAGKIIKTIDNANKYKKIALILLLLDSALNPHLFSTYGALILAISMSPTPKLNEKDIREITSHSRRDRKYIERAAI